MASEIRVDKINSLSGVGTVTLSPTGVDIAGITTVSTLSVGSSVGIGTTNPSSILHVSGSSTPIILNKSTDASPALFIGDSNRDTEGQHLAEFRGRWNGTPVARMIIEAGDDTSNKDNGELTFETAPAGSMIERLRIKSSGDVVVGSAVTISESGIEASGIGITCANINGTQIGGRRNLIINGDMRVAQRATSSIDANYSTVDRMRAAKVGVDESPTFSRATLTSAPGPYREGHRRAYKITNGNQTSGAGSNDVIAFSTRLEAQDVANSGWDYTQTNSFITLQFWVKSSVAQNFYIRLFTQDGTQKNYPMETGTLTANTWTKVIKTIPGHADLQFDNDINRGLDVDFSVFRGTDQTASGVTLNQWANLDATAKIPDMTSTWFTTNDATFFITGLQLEVGSQATPFEHRSFAEELRLCQRYFYKNTDSPVGLFIADAADTDQAYGFLRFPVAMRAAPTVVLSDNNGNTDGKVTQHGAGHNIAATATQIQKEGFAGCNATSTTWNVNSARPIIAGVASADAEI